MSAHMSMRTTGESVEINLSGIVSAPESRLLADALRGVLALVGQEIRPVNEEGDELIPAEEVFPDTQPGDMVKGIRKREGITQKIMADKLGVKQRHISEMEKVIRPITLKMAKRIGNTFNISYKIFL